MLRELPRLAELGSRIQTEMRGDRLEKQDRTPVTVADFAIQAVFAHRLSQFDPGIALVAEERSLALQSSATTRLWDRVTEYVAALEPDATRSATADWIDLGAGEPAGRFWTLDPIDGTKGFLRNEQWVIAAALVEAGQVVLAGLVCPHLDLTGQSTKAGPGCIIAASQGEGSWATSLHAPDNGFVRLHVAEQRDPSRARLLASVESSHTNHRQIAATLASMGNTAEILRMDSQAKYAALACGRAEMLLRLPTDEQQDYREKIWDQAAGSLIVEEAGGRVSDMHGKRLDFRTGRKLSENQGVVATNGVLHETILAALAAVLEGR